MYIIRSSSSFNPKIVYEKIVLSAKNMNFSFEVNYLYSFENKNKTILKKLLTFTIIVNNKQSIIILVLMACPLPPTISTVENSRKNSKN